MKPELKEIEIYPGIAPGSENIQLEEEFFEEATPSGSIKQIVQNVVKPTITPFWADGENNAAIIIIPGGAYRRMVINFEGIDVARWLNAHGISAFLLKSRLPVNEHNYRYDVALMDTMRAMRVIRANAKKWNIDKNRIGVMGFSAGGSMASALATCYDKKFYEPVDDIDRIPARPDFAVLGYPAINAEVELRSRLYRIMGSKANSAIIEEIKTAEGKTEFTIDGKKITEEMKKEFGIHEYLMETITKYSTDKLVTSDTPPAFIFETDDDAVTLSMHSIQYYLACKKANVPAELHIFQKGEHGFGLGDDNEDGETGQWKELFLKWFKINFENNR